MAKSIRDGFKNFVEWCGEVILFGSFDVKNSCAICHKKVVHIKLSDKVGFCGIMCKDKAFKQFEEYRDGVLSE